ncbi:uroporphyrin-III C-methyltransferase/precorrin-2 dehydrogenase/sirohydrochlorin ferrochelatase [Blastococcus colisei]|uniref:Uroporphyrin-III C-methyltransferase/precorrin-2 dehydrogenase/sirohydrochlorin ferrochelatase n=1 Tax=Blastococcus colisei TaxID=1564162 RepID=A0A543PIX6_9ACTN|nr:uroporphyrinogen-III C-methyltransferase [Blastococcus colisei]TQN44032.1 uroporphyrin-III C-methyltransferase/precorrin-2 dehydrogenase/sirohydrochlorin ferrochelatase [Blastococcus colisei]
MTTAPQARSSTAVLPVGLRLLGRRVVVVGGGPTAHRETAGLLAVGADVAVVSPALTPALDALAISGGVSWIRRTFTEGDLDGAWYAVAATGDAGVDAKVAAEADSRHIFCTRTESHELSSAVVQATAGRDRHCEEQGAAEGLTGCVVLVGGGPGDPGLITVRGQQALSQADVVVVDHLAPWPLLGVLRPGAEVVDASKLPRGRSMAQEEINALLVSRARAGKYVVRLKGGDPFVFGRGMEELLACAAAEIPVEVVPGVTSAVGVPAVAGIPVTHRGLTHEFVVISGHLPPGHPQSLVDWSSIGRLRGTVVVLMGVENAAAIAATLIDHGRPTATPVAVVTDGTTASQRTVRTTLEHLGTTIRDEHIRPPAVWVVGEVVQLAAETVARTSAGAPRADEGRSGASTRRGAGGDRDVEGRSVTVIVPQV